MGTPADARGTRIIVVDNDAFIRATLTSALEGRGLAVVGSYPDARSALADRAHMTIEVAVLDLDLGVGPNGLDVAHALRTRHPRIGLVMLTHYRDPRLLTTDIPRWPAGMRYLAKSDVDDVTLLVAAILSAREAPLRAPRGSGVPDEDLAVLTTTQIEVLRAVAQGYSTAEIARMRCAAEAPPVSGCTSPARMEGSCCRSVTMAPVAAPSPRRPEWGPPGWMRWCPACGGVRPAPMERCSP